MLALMPGVASCCCWLPDTAFSRRCRRAFLPLLPPLFDAGAMALLLLHLPPCQLLPPACHAMLPLLFIWYAATYAAMRQFFSLCLLPCLMRAATADISLMLRLLILSLYCCFATMPAVLR